MKEATCQEIVIYRPVPDVVDISCHGHWGAAGVSDPRI